MAPKPNKPSAATTTTTTTNGGGGMIRAPSPPPLLPRLFGSTWDDTSRTTPDIWNKCFGPDSDSETEEDAVNANNATETLREAGAKNLYNPSYLKNKMDEQVLKCIKYRLNLQAETSKDNIRAIIIVISIILSYCAFFLPGIDVEFRSGSEFTKRRIALACCIAFMVLISYSFFLVRRVPWNSIMETQGRNACYVVSSLSKHSTNYALKLVLIANKSVTVQDTMDLTELFAPSSRPDSTRIFAKVEALYGQFEAEVKKKNL